LDERETTLLCYQPFNNSAAGLYVRGIFEQINFDILNVFEAFASEKCIIQRISSEIRNSENF
jgi:hypothetical protein